MLYVHAHLTVRAQCIHEGLISEDEQHPGYKLSTNIYGVRAEALKHLFHFIFLVYSEAMSFDSFKHI